MKRTLFPLFILAAAPAFAGASVRWTYVEKLDTYSFSVTDGTWTLKVGGGSNYIIENYSGTGGVTLDLSTLASDLAAEGHTASVKTIQSRAFKNFTTLETLVLPASCKSIDYNAFEGCTALTTVDAPGVTLVANGSFRGCTALVSVNMPALSRIEHGSFQDCTALPEMLLPGAATIGSTMFVGCRSLARVVFGPNFQYAGERTFGDNPNILVDQHLWFNNFPSRGFHADAFAGSKRYAVTLHMEWAARDEWNAWMSTNGVFLVHAPETPYARGDMEKGTSWTETGTRQYLMWWHVPIVSVGGTDYLSLRDAIDAAGGSPIMVLAPNVADFTDERVTLAKDESFVLVDDGEHALGYLPGVPDVPGWNLFRSRQVRNGTAVVVYKAVGPSTVMLMK